MDGTRWKIAIQLLEEWYLTSDGFGCDECQPQWPSKHIDIECEIVSLWDPVGSYRIDDIELVAETI